MDDAAPAPDASADPVEAARVAFRADGGEAARRAAAALLGARIAAGKDGLRAALERGETDGLGVARALAALIDETVRAALEVALIIHRNPHPTAAERLTVAAVGGYGRAEMAPFSDVDLLFLRPYKTTAWSESVIETALYLLWDLKLKVGYSVRTIDECLRLARSDVTIRTALLERRLVWGDAEPMEELATRLWRDLFQKTGPEFVEAKLAERAERHRRNGGSRYLVEPNVKESKGGLRDLQTLYWLAKYLYNVETVPAMVEKGVFTEAEVRPFTDAERFLWTVRCHLHFLAGRGQESLSFDMQVEIAEAMGFEDAGGRRGVELFMQRYFRAAKDVGDLTRWFCSALEHEQKKARPIVGALARALGFRSAPDLAEGFRFRDGRIDVAEPELFDREPVAMFRLFSEGLRTGALVHPDAMREIAARGGGVDDALRADPEANRLFIEMLCDSDDPERALRRMNECGLLGRFIPQFGRVVAMTQFNMYHAYTVDEHTIIAVGGLARIVAGEFPRELPVSSELMKAGIDRRVLFSALFLHDIGKGLPEDHSIVGAAVARDLCPRFGLDAAQCEMVEWLVRNHLLMSDVAQKRDISDPRTVRAFADEVRSPERLRLLMVLTVCDIRAVGPGVWNNWKAQLLRTLYWDARALLTGGYERLSRAERIEEAREALRAALSDWSAEEVEAELARHYPPYWLGVEPEAKAAAARLAREHDHKRVSLRIDADPERGATRVMIYMADHPGLFGRMAGAIALARADIVDARTYTTADGMAISAFWIQDPDGGAYEPEQFARLERSILRSLKGEVAPRTALAAKRRSLRRRERPFDWPTRISFDNEASDIYTVIEVESRDRVGLLHDLTRALAGANINIFSAVIATYGQQVVDVFYVKDLFGLKIRSAAKQKTVARRLRDAVEQAAADVEGSG